MRSRRNLFVGMLICGLIGLLGLASMARAEDCKPNGKLNEEEVCDPGNPLTNPDTFRPGVSCARMLITPSPFASCWGRRLRLLCCSLPR